MSIPHNKVPRQTETGSIVLAPFPGAVETKPGSATVPFFGHEPVILDPTTGEVRLFGLPEQRTHRSISVLKRSTQELKGNNVEGVLALKTPWPSIARTIYGDHKRYLETYMQVVEHESFTTSC